MTRGGRSRALAGPGARTYRVLAALSFGGLAAHCGAKVVDAVDLAEARPDAASATIVSDASELGFDDATATDATGDDATTGACGAQTCPTGCCATDGTCLAGTANRACGGGGSLCGDCTWRGETCFRGHCVTVGNGSGGGFGPTGGYGWGPYGGYGWNPYGGYGLGPRPSLDAGSDAGSQARRGVMDAGPG